MPYPYPFGETVQVVRRVQAGVDEDNNPAYSEQVDAYEQCAVWPSDGNGSGGNEYTDARDTVIIGLTAVLPPGVDAAAIDRVIVRGDEWEVMGDPQRLPSPLTGTDPGTPVQLRRVTG